MDNLTRRALVLFGLAFTLFSVAAIIGFGFKNNFGKPFLAPPDPARNEILVIGKHDWPNIFWGRFVIYIVYRDLNTNQLAEEVLVRDVKVIFHYTTYLARPYHGSVDYAVRGEQRVVVFSKEARQNLNRQFDALLQEIDAERILREVIDPKRLEPQPVPLEERMALVRGALASRTSFFISSC